MKKKIVLKIGIIRLHFNICIIFFCKNILSEIIIICKYILLQFRALVFLCKNFVLWLVLKTSSTAHAPCTLAIIPWKYGAGEFQISTLKPLDLHFMVQFPLKSGIPMKKGNPQPRVFYIATRFLKLMHIIFTYSKIASSNTFRLEAHVGLFRLLMKGILDTYLVWHFDKKLIY